MKHHIQQQRKFSKRRNKGVSNQILTKSRKIYKKLKENKLKEKLKLSIYEIQKNPYIGQAKKGDLNNIYGFDVFYNKTNYEISYQIYPDKEIVVIILVGTRENFYNELKKYINTL